MPHASGLHGFRDILDINAAKVETPPVFGVGAGTDLLPDTQGIGATVGVAGEAATFNLEAAAGGVVLKGDGVGHAGFLCLGREGVGVRSRHLPIIRFGVVCQGIW
jgi:hypothetical protein